MKILRKMALKETKFVYASAPKNWKDEVGTIADSAQEIRTKHYKEREKLAGTIEDFEDQKLSKITTNSEKITTKGGYLFGVLKRAFGGTKEAFKILGRLSDNNKTYNPEAKNVDRFMKGDKVKIENGYVVVERANGTEEKWNFVKRGTEKSKNQQAVANEKAKPKDVKLQSSHPTSTLTGQATNATNDSDLFQQAVADEKAKSRGIKLQSSHPTSTLTGQATNATNDSDLFQQAVADEKAKSRGIKLQSSHQTSTLTGQATNATNDSNLFQQAVANEKAKPKDVKLQSSHPTSTLTGQAANATNDADLLKTSKEASEYKNIPKSEWKDMFFEAQNQTFSTYAKKHNNTIPDFILERFDTIGKIPMDTAQDFSDKMTTLDSFFKDIVNDTL